MKAAVQALLILGVIGATACARHGFVHDGTSVSQGRAFDGRLVNGVRLPARGDGYQVPARWVLRGNVYGTDELVTMIVRVARRVHRETGQRLGVADLSPRGGGESRWHRSHQTGRDVDLLLFAMSRSGRPLPSEAMVRFKDDGSSKELDAHDQPTTRRYFDTRRNWLLVRALLEEPTVEVQRIYIYEPLKQMLLAHARAIEERPELVARADALMEQPVDSSPHDDHIHVRIRCPDSDRQLGCEDSREPAIPAPLIAYQHLVVMAAKPLLGAVLRLAHMEL